LITHFPARAGISDGVYVLDPLHDSRWRDLLARHPNASIFHSSEWLGALAQTYSYAPVAFTTSPPGESLGNALVLCAVRSWITGRRLVSLPFSDHCEPLVDSTDDLIALAAAAERYRAEHGWRYVELRPIRADHAPGASFGKGQAYWLHQLDLRPSVDALWRGFHRDSIQRRIRKAERTDLEYEEGRSASTIGKLYELLELTRRRHSVPPQPRAWLHNLVSLFGEAVSIRVASFDGRPVAAILALSRGKTVVYKYGGSDARYHSLGATPLLFWKMIQDAKRRGAETLDLGRTDCDNEGLTVFKERWGARRSTLTYWRSPAAAAAGLNTDSKPLRVARRLYDTLPMVLRRATANRLYRHLG
jgi:CelD/BcsL family acetyltransferase involved in cellulose biosynthesis